MLNQGIVGRPPLGRIDGLNRMGIKTIAAKPIDRLSGKCHKLALLDKLRPQPQAFFIAAPHQCIHPNHPATLFPVGSVDICFDQSSFIIILPQGCA